MRSAAHELIVEESYEFVFARRHQLIHALFAIIMARYLQKVGAFGMSDCKQDRSRLQQNLGNRLARPFLQVKINWSVIGIGESKRVSGRFLAWYPFELRSEPTREQNRSRTVSRPMCDLHLIDLAK